MMNYAWYDLVGNIGVALILISYLLLQMNKWSSEAISYSIVNALGALFILISLYFDFNLSAVIVEFAWFIISLYGVFRGFQKKSI